MLASSFHMTVLIMRCFSFYQIVMTLTCSVSLSKLSMHYENLNIDFEITMKLVF